MPDIMESDSLFPLCYDLMFQVFWRTPLESVRVQFAPTLHPVTVFSVYVLSTVEDSTENIARMDFFGHNLIRLLLSTITLPMS